MTERPIIFSAPMVRAILAGTKTQTRRVITPEPDKRWVKPICENGWWMWEKWAPQYRQWGYWKQKEGDRLCPFGVSGDRLWVREAWLVDRYDGSTQYRASHPCPELPKWKSSIHMPRARSRLLLEVSAIRVERLQEITDNDAKAEGIDEEDYPPPPEDQEYVFNYRAAYAQLWDSLNAKRGFAWSLNPWVWVIEFRRAEKPLTAAQQYANRERHGHFGAGHS